MNEWYTPRYPYKEGTTLLAILRDGWARGFTLRQTYDEAQMMGFSKSCTADLIRRVWAHEDRKFERWVARQCKPQHRGRVMEFYRR